MGHGYSQDAVSSALPSSLFALRGLGGNAYFNPYTVGLGSAESEAVGWKGIVRVGGCEA